VSDASPLLGLEGVAAQRVESDAFEGRWCMSWPQMHASTCPACWSGSH